MMISLALVISGLALLVAGGELLLRGAVALATLARVTPAVIGLTVVAAGTSVPELAVSLIAALRGNEAVAIGNVVGSNIFNITFILGLAAVIRPLAISGNTIRLEYPVLALVTLLYLTLSADGWIGRLDALLFLSAYVGFTMYLIAVVRRQMSDEEQKEIKAEVRELSAPSVPKGWVSLVLVTSGIALLGAGAQATVTGAVDLGRLFGLSETIIGLTIVAVGTSLPEVVTSLVSSARGRDDVAIGNVIGSNIFNILGILGISGLIHPVAVAGEIVASDNWWMLGVTIFLFPLIFTGRQIARWEGPLLLGAYAIYLAFLLERSGAV